MSLKYKKIYIDLKNKKFALYFIENILTGCYLKLIME
jgi:hypothetical protein